MLVSERNTDDGDVKQQAKKQVREHDGQAADKEPDYIHNKRQAPRSCVVLYRFFIKRQQGHLCQFQRLQAEGDTDYCNHQANTGYNVFDGNEYTSENNPDHISQCPHRTAIASISTMQFLGRPLAAMAERAGKSPSNCKA